MDYETAEVAEIAEHFRTVTRQRVAQILKKYQDRGDTPTAEKIVAAKGVLKQERYLAKHGVAKEAARANDIWQGIQQRVGKIPSYMDCTVEWQTPLEFRLWAVQQIGFAAPGFELDKDVLVKGNRVYGPSTCVFLPQEINVLFSGCYRSGRRGPYPIGVSFNKGSGTFVAQMSNRQEAGLDKYLGSFATVEEAFACYKAAKEKKIKALADKWKDQIDPRAYDALMVRTVEMDD